jgi:carbon monoxide dehydrogenase subunit G
MNDLKNTRFEWTTQERVYIYVAQKYPEIIDEALNAIVEQDIKKLRAQL